MAFSCRIVRQLEQSRGRSPVRGLRDICVGVPQAGARVNTHQSAVPSTNRSTKRPAHVVQRTKRVCATRCAQEQNSAWYGASICPDPSLSLSLLSLCGGNLSICLSAYSMHDDVYALFYAHLCTVTVIIIVCTYILPAHMYMHICIYAYMHICIYAYIYMCVCVCVCVCVYFCVYVPMHLLPAPARPAIR